MNRLGDLATDAGALTRARELHQRALSIHEALAARDPDNSGYQRDLAFSLVRLGDLATDAGALTRARELHQRALSIHEALARENQL